MKNKVVEVLRSQTCDDRVAVDVLLVWNGREIEVTLLPAEDGRGEWNSWGPSPDCWCSDFTGMESEELQDLEAFASEAAEKVYPCPLGRSSYLSREAWEALDEE